MQIANPLKFSCLPNEATPDYVAYTDFHRFVAYGLWKCWMSSDDQDLNADCDFRRPISQEDVCELRGYFLDLVETVIVSLWKGDYSPGDGAIDGDFQSLIIKPNEVDDNDNENSQITWYVRLDKDAIMFELSCTSADSEAIWLRYEALHDRKNILKVLTEARKTIKGEVWQTLIGLVS